MASNALERAVIEAARAYVNQLDAVEGSELGSLVDAVDALEAHEAGQAPEVKERGWHEVAEGDQLLSVKTQRFYPVLKTLKILKGSYEITVLVGDKEKTIVRPSAAEPAATIKRGVTGDAVDMLVHVFASGVTP